MLRYWRAYPGQGLLTILSLALVAAVFWGLLPLGRMAYGNLQAQLERQREYRHLETRRGAADSLTAVYDQVLHAAHQVRNALPTDGRASHILTLLTQNAAEHELSISDIRSLDGLAHGDYMEFPFELGLSGRFPQLAEYCAGLEGRDMVLRIRRLAVSTEDIHKPDVKAQLELSVYLPQD